MIHTALGYNGSISAPHRAAALAGRDILESGGTAIEAMVAAAAAVAVVYPHMNGIGGDGFWIIQRAGEAPVGISGCGRAAELATADWYAHRGHTHTIPPRGAGAALTVPGTLSGWQRALDMVPQARRIPLADLLSAAVGYARGGTAVTGNQSGCTRDKLESLAGVPGFADAFLVDGNPPEAGYRLRQAALGRTLETLASEGIEAFYRGDIAAEHALFLEEHGSPLRFGDFAQFTAETVEPLSATTSDGVLYNMTPPTQGISSLMILALFDRLDVTQGEGFDHVHGLVEATKQAFLIRNSTLGDPDTMEEPAAAWLAANRLDDLAARIDRRKALPWPHPPKDGDTVWMGAVDREAMVVSFIQSVFWEFGSGFTCPATGVVFQNRGAGFSLKPGPNQLAPGKRPFHTLNPALARLADGRVMAYGTMGGEGQPQTQAAVFTRYARFKQDLQQAISMPRWLLGKTWGDTTTTLKLESRFDPSLVSALKAAGNEVELIEPYSDLAGHAGAVVLHESGLMEAASDPRSDGAALAY
ncbi:gamma-glutamyltransferase family protein [Chelativorans alearense]|uniref:gamma-glutamyltransferase family protein n=1 Tax=Chelativorans alearense TaxID=2681495 RepID=UPI0013D257C7|nr:gamma-glutamyltransferase family protein [Chelativorans alearense]